MPDPQGAGDRERTGPRLSGPFSDGRRAAGGNRAERSLLVRQMSKIVTFPRQAARRSQGRRGAARGDL